MLTTTCIMCGGKISWNAVACPHCGDPGHKLREKMRREDNSLDAQKGIFPKKMGITQHIINVFFNVIIGVVILGGLAIGFYLLSTVFR